MLLQDLLVATVLLEQMDNYYAKQGKKKKISVSSKKEAYLYFTPVFFVLKIWCSGWYVYFAFLRSQIQTSVVRPATYLDQGLLQFSSLH